MLLTIYRRPNATITIKFYEEFSSIFEDLVTQNSQLIILGGFNIHLKASSSASRFLLLLTQLVFDNTSMNPLIVQVDYSWLVIKQNTMKKMKSGSIVKANLQKVSFVHVDTKCEVLPNLNAQNFYKSTSLA